jgi:glycosyltransferase involved in cell wall biosynthesis
MEKTSLSVIVPAYNEEFLIAESLNRLCILEECPYLEKIQIIGVNDGSTDNTAGAANEFINRQSSNRIEWLFIDQKKNGGKGTAIQKALIHASCTISIIHDADLEYHPKDIYRMLPLFLNEGADAVYGSRFAGSEFRRILFFRHELGNRFITFICNLVSNLNLTDIETCYKAIKTELLKSIPIVSNDFRIEPELTIKLAKRKALIFEIPINYSGRTYAEGKKIGWKDGIKAIWAILKFGLSDNIFQEDIYGSKILLTLSRAKKFNHWLSEIIAPHVGQSVLEIGAGVGNLTTKFLRRKSYYATDINPFYINMVENFKTNNPSLEVVYLDLNDVSTLSDSNQKFDTIICLNVVEHLDDDEKALANIAKLLHENGNAIVLVPYGMWLFGSQDEVLGHRRRYSEKMIKDLASKVGLKLNYLIRFNRVSTIPWFINGRIFKKRSFSRFQIFILDLFIPLLKIIDKYLPWPSLSLIAILEKNS